MRHLRSNGVDGPNGIISFDENGSPWLDRKCNLKNYESDIERFLDWIAPAVALQEREPVGGYMVEHDDDPMEIVWDPEARQFFIDGLHRGPDIWRKLNADVSCEVDDGDVGLVRHGPSFAWLIGPPINPTRLPVVGAEMEAFLGHAIVNEILRTSISVSSPRSRARWSASCRRRRRI